MDFRHQILGADALAGLTCDALVLIVTGDAVDTTLDAPLGAALSDALAHDDFKLKAGKCLYLHRPAGVRAPRVVFSVAGANTAKAFKAAVTTGIRSACSLPVPWACASTMIWCLSSTAATPV